MLKRIFLLLVNLVLVLAKDEELPLCPTNIQFFPQTLPMHCRMPRSTDAQFPSFPGLPPAPLSLSEPFYQSPPPDTQPQPIPIPIPPPPGSFPYPGGPIPGVPMPAGPLPGPMPMPMPMPGPGHKLPVIVMPFYSPDPAYRKPSKPRRRPPSYRPKFGHTKNYPRGSRYYDTDTDSGTDSDTSVDLSSDISSDLSREHKWWKHRRSSKKSARRFNKKHIHSRKSKKRHSKQKNELLTPVLQYVTKEGYVIFEKKIYKGEAKDWLRVKNDKKAEVDHESDEDSSEDKQRGKEEVRSKEDKNKSQEEYDKDVNEEKDRQEPATDKTHKRHQQHKPNLLLDDNKM